jgi:2-polyprenyl-3-methyl-5-hydroxy-6-metoxy-1,4-benzoquinol methylase
MADNKHVCPIWVGYLLSSPLRRLFQNPKQILESYIVEGMKILDVGCAMGFFSLPMAQLAGPTGKIICVDIQERMLKVLEKRAQKAGLLDRITTHVSSPSSLGLEHLGGEIDFVLASAVVHEVPNVSNFFSEIFKTVKLDGQVLIVEPKGHTSAEAFEKAVYLARQSGFHFISNPEIKRNYAALLAKR